jgi:hypothetical protein
MRPACFQLLLPLAALLLGCHPRPAVPPPRCVDAWQAVPVPARTYDFTADARPTPLGNQGYAPYADRLLRRGCRKEWTVLLYMAADAADLAAPALRDLRAIEDPQAAAGSTPQADVVAELDRRAPAPTARFHLFRTPAAPASSAATAPALASATLTSATATATPATATATLRSPIVETLPPDLATPEDRLTRFLTWGVERYPSDHYAVIVWGHGLGWRPAPSGATGKLLPVRYDRAGTSGGIAFDETHGTTLDTPGLRRALAALARDHLGGRPVDLYASDACLMQSVEVAGELAGAARFVVGSEQIEEDYLGLPYRTWLPLLNGSTPLPPAPTCAADDVACRAAAALPPSLRAEVDRGAAAPGFTLAAVDQTALAADLVPALRRLAAAMEAYVAEDDLRRIGLQVLLGVDRGATRGTPGFRGGTRDVGLFLARLVAEVERQPGGASAGRAALLGAAQAARTALGRSVLSAAFGARYASPGFEGLAGLSVWLPHDVDEYRGRAWFFAPSVLHRESPSFRGFLERIFAPPPS